MRHTSEHPDVRYGYVIATWLQRLTAYFMDRLMVGAALALGAVGVTDAVSDDFDIGLNEEQAPLLNDITGGELGWGLFFAACAVLFVYVVWFLFTCRGGQTPGKQLVGLRVIRSNGEPSGWGHTFVREVILGWLAIGFLSVVTAGIFYVINYLWPLWNKDRQALHDKMAETLVVMAHPLSAYNPLPAASGARSDTPGAGSDAPAREAPPAERSEDAPDGDDTK